jgi:Tol biopolymer transport system component
MAVSGSAAGAFVYRAATLSRRQFVWFDRNGARGGAIGEPDDLLGGGERSWQLSPDGRFVASVRRISNNSDIWLIDTARGVPRRLITDPASEAYPLWSPDGSRIIFGSSRLHGSVIHDLFVKSIGGAEDQMTLLESGENKAPTSWSRDGRLVMYSVLSRTTGNDLWVLPLDGNKKPFAFAQTPSHEQAGVFSPDGRWVAYQSNETGRFEIYLRPFPGPAASTLVSTGGGTSPSWSKDGREIVYKGLDNRVMAIPVSLGSAGVDAGTPVPLFTLPSNATFDVTSDGKRLLVNAALDEGTTAPITVVMNWTKSNP